MKFRNFPALVQKEILDHLEIDYVFLLSLLSCRMNLLIQSFSWKGIKKIAYCTMGAHISIDAITANNNRLTVAMLRPFNEMIKKSKSSLYISGQNFECCPETEKHSFTILLNESPHEPIVRLVYNHIEKLFGKHLGIWFSAHTNSQNKLFLPMYVKPERIEIGYLTFEDSNNFYNWISKISNLECISVYNYSNVELYANRCFYNSKTVLIRHVNWIAVDILYNFKGHSCVLSGAKCQDFDIIMFILKWKKNTGYRELKLLDISLQSGIFFNSQRIKKEFDIQTTHSENEFVLHHPTDTFTVTKHGGLFDEKTYSHRQFIKRDTDQSIASIKITNKQFEFIVWNFS